MTAGPPQLDDALIEACQREQQSMLGYSDTRDEIARKIVALLGTRADFTRDQVIAHIGMARDGE